MTTTSVATTANSAPPLPVGPAAASRQAESASTPFSHMLSEKMADKPQSGSAAPGRAADSADKNTAGPTTEKPAAGEKTATPAPEQNKPGSGQEEEAKTDIPMLSPELAAMVAGLLQRQGAPKDAAAGEAADPLALLGKSLSHGGGDLHAQQDVLGDMDDAKLAANERLLMSSLQGDASAGSDLDLLATDGKQVASDLAGKDASGFSSMLQHLTQAGQAGQARNASGPAAAHLAPRVGVSGWDQALGQRLVWMASGAEQSASLTLNPPELGPLQVVLNVSNSQANATFVAPHAEVRQALEAAMPRLREMLGEVGIQLDQASVNQGMPQQQGEFARSDSQAGSHARGRGGNNEQAAAEPVVSRRIDSAGTGLVDTFA